MSSVFFNYVGFEVITVVVMKSAIFWDIMPCSLLKVNQALPAASFHSGFLLGLFLNPEDGRGMSLRNYTAVYPRR
jgi:hypothetical protein